MMAIAFGPDEISPQDLDSLTHPVCSQLQAYLRGTHLPLDRYRLLAIRRWLVILQTKPVHDWPDLHRAGRDASRVLGEMVDALDTRVHQIEDSIALGFLDWSMIRRHMLLQSRRSHLVRLSVDMDDMVHALLSLY